MNIMNIAKTRYATKSFDASKSITDEQFTQLQELLQLSPSSTNIQPWHFVMTKDEVGKQRITKGTEAKFPFNTPKILNASAVVVFCSRLSKTTDNDYLKHILEQEDKDGRYPSDEFKQNTYKGRQLFSNLHLYELKDHQHWLEKQVYLNIGNFALGVAALGLDAIVMEGVDLQALDEEFDLRTQGFTSVAVVSIGYHADSDYNMPEKTPKSRLPLNEIITLV